MPKTIRVIPLDALAGNDPPPRTDGAQPWARSISPWHIAAGLLALGLAIPPLAFGVPMAAAALWPLAMTATGMAGMVLGFVWPVLLPAAVFIYMLPAYLAYRWDIARGQISGWVCFNLLAGWTILVWCWLLEWAIEDHRLAQRAQGPGTAGMSP